MVLDVKFDEQNSDFELDFRTETMVSDGGYERGYGEGYKEGEKAGYDLGYADGLATGLENGKSEGYSNGYADGYKDGNDAGTVSGTADIMRSMCARTAWQLNVPDDVTEIVKEAFENSAVGVANLNNVKIIRTQSFNGCASLITINGDNVETLEGSAFNDCRYLETAVFSKLTTIENYALAYCGQYKTNVRFIFRNNAVCTLKSTSVFNGSAIARGTGYIYVPDDLVNSYKTATNWSTYARQIKPLSELEE